MTKLFLIQLKDNECKKVVADNMVDALNKYQNYLYEQEKAHNYSYEYNPYNKMAEIVSCSCMGEYMEEDVIM